jgi:hypothetical protein
VLIAIGLAAFGVATLTVFLGDLASARVVADHGWVPWEQMPSPYIFAGSLTVPSDGAIALQALCAVLAGGCVRWAWRAPQAPFEARAPALAAGSR